MRSVLPPTGSLEPPLTSLSAGVVEVALQLRSVLEVLDRLSTDPGRPGQSTEYHLGEARRAIHHALFALSECAETLGAL
ncbi:MAG TPA: hypothetical protein VED63_01170 [Acidimicrobiales bacterium]|nr:hypothetical protein [Acidimicrobiales bacterium]